MQQIVINVCHGGFGLSTQAEVRYHQLTNRTPVYSWELQRDCRHLVKVVQELGAAANTKYSKLKIVEVPDGLDWTVMEYDGLEWVAEAHRTWS
jgi:hypothetical protein